MPSINQINANKANSLLGGVKTTDGKAVSRYNAQKHLILRESFTEYEAADVKELADDLFSFYEPEGKLEEVLVERIVVCLIKLIRLQKAEGEYLKSVLHPRMVESTVGEWFTVVKEDGYTPKLNQQSVEVMSLIYSRYETAIENRMFRSIHELERLRRYRNGEVIPSPIMADVNNLGSFGNNQL